MFMVCAMALVLREPDKAAEQGGSIIAEFFDAGTEGGYAGDAGSSGPYAA